MLSRLFIAALWSPAGKGLLQVFLCFEGFFVVVFSCVCLLFVRLVIHLFLCLFKVLLKSNSTVYGHCRTDSWVVSTALLENTSQWLR